jgi:predicted ribosome quality control (RQC) complex YloA/Tae2 family protein
LRKYLRSRSLVSVSQVYNDRIIKFVFGRDIHTLSLYVEMYAAGNIILTDVNDDILAIQRIVTLKPTDAESAEIKYAPGEKYFIKEAIEEPLSDKSVLSRFRTYRDTKDVTARKLTKGIFGHQFGPALIEHVLSLCSLSLVGLHRLKRELALIMTGHEVPPTNDFG